MHICIIYIYICNLWTEGRELAGAQHVSEVVHCNFCRKGAQGLAFRYHACQNVIWTVIPHTSPIGKQIAKWHRWVGLAAFASQYTRTNAILVKVIRVLTLKPQVESGLAVAPEPQLVQLGSILLLDAEVVSLQYRRANIVGGPCISTAAIVRRVSRAQLWHKLTCKGGPSRRLCLLQVKLLARAETIVNIYMQAHHNVSIYMIVTCAIRQRQHMQDRGYTQCMTLSCRALTNH